MKLRKFGNKKLGSPVKNAKKVSAQDNNDQVKEKTIYAIDPGPEIKSEEDVPQKIDRLQIIYIITELVNGFIIVYSF